MLCQICKQNNAVTFIQKRDGRRNEMMPICAACAEKLQYTDWSDLLEYFLNTSRQTVTCPLCGTTADEISKTGLVGCSQCYVVFDRMLRPSIERIHGKTVYRGKVPAVIVNNLPEEKTAVEQLKEKLKIAVLNEDYESAALLRDQIRKIQREERNK